MSAPIDEEVRRLLGEIGSLREAFVSAIEVHRKDSEIDFSFDSEKSVTDWCTNIFCNSLIRLRLIIDQSFVLVEPLSLLAATRYIFELSIWLKLLRLDPKYGIVYYSELLRTQLRYYEDCEKQHLREIELLKALDAEEEEKREALIPQEKTQLKLVHAMEQMSAVSAEIDAKAARKFSIYSDQAKHNGYSFQAFLVAKKLPEIRDKIAALKSVQTSFMEKVSDENKALLPKRWNWKEWGRNGVRLCSL